MTAFQRLILTSVRTVKADDRRVWRAKAVALETAQTQSEVTREALFLYAMTGSAVASIVIIIAPYLEIPRCVLSGRG